MNSIRLLIVLALCAAVIPVSSQNLIPIQKLKQGQGIITQSVPTDADRETVHTLIEEHQPDMLYLDAHHVACTEWDIIRICQAAAEKNTGVLMRIDHADQAGMISSMLDLGHDIFIVKHPLFKNIQDCSEFVKKSLEGTGVYF